jgi:hypothetical protein
MTKGQATTSERHSLVFGDLDLIWNPDVEIWNLSIGG